MGSPVVVDTNVISYLYKDNILAVPYSGVLRGRKLFCSFATVAEIAAGIRIAHWSANRVAKLEAHLQSYEVLHSSFGVVERYVDIHTLLRRLGRPTSVNDVWIAATAMAYELPLVTHNRRHFQPITGLELISLAP